MIRTFNPPMRTAVMILLMTSGAAMANLLSNASFEQDGENTESAQHWRIDVPNDHGDAWGTAIRSNWRAFDGYHAGAIRGGWTGMGEYGGFWQEAKIESGKTYKASAWFWADHSWHADTQEFKLEFWNEDRTEMVGESTLPLRDISESWTQREITADAPGNAVWGRVVINVNGAGHHGALQIDKVELDAAR